MKTLEEIEKLSLEDLEKISADRTVKAPEKLRAKIAAGLFLNGHSHKKARSRIRFGYVCAAACLATVLALTLPVFQSQKPKDTFDNPVEALTQLDRTFSYISEKMDKGLGMAEKGVSLIDRPVQMISEIQKK